MKYRNVWAQLKTSHESSPVAILQEQITFNPEETNLFLPLRWLSSKRRRNNSPNNFKGNLRKNENTFICSERNPSNKYFTYVMKAKRSERYTTPGSLEWRGERSSQ
ncbi:hypothetical protein CDAR_48921 [Caerostris darwini]|uniref:Uncharacterized protein n=1 Tax=Caerostris darwini TaxID=1538125 RepID=A0AAV4NHL9_9ARAC|nr:hypothetical protein CDAR_48921 [Caerostris darwini]